MRKLTAALLLMTVLAGLCACKKEKPQVEVTPTPAPTAAASGTDAAVAATPPASATDAGVNAGLYETARQYIGRSASELIAAVGQPTSSQYAPSCLEENAEDGMLMYDAAGFYVWTVRNAAGETVHEVNLNQ